MDNEQLKLENQLCFRLYSAARLMTSAYHPYLDPLGITYPQYLVLLVLWEQDKQPVCDIGKRLLLDTNTMTPLLQRMEKAGLITRTRGNEDTRQRIVALTKQGKALYEQAENIPENMRKAVMMPDQEMEEILQMVPSLDKLIEELKKLNK
jgi:DNA-binding MarR family transcriptional regulator